MLIAARLKGISVVALATVSIPWVMPIKKRLTTEVEGSPTMSPPIREPKRSAINSDNAMYIPPIMNERNTRIQNISIVKSPDKS